MSNYDINDIDFMNEVNYNRDTSKSNSFNINKEDSITSQNSIFINSKNVNINSIEEYDTSSNNKSISMLNKKRDKTFIRSNSPISKITESLKQKKTMILNNTENKENTHTCVDNSKTEMKKVNKKTKIKRKNTYMLRNTNKTSDDENYCQKHAVTRKISFSFLSFSFSELNLYKSLLREIKKNNHYVNSTFLNRIT